jgi:hypothetical protein
MQTSILPFKRTRGEILPGQNVRFRTFFLKLLSEFRVCYHPECRVGVGNNDMRELADGLTPWDWSDAEVVLFAGPGEEINLTIGRQSQRHITTELRVMYDDLVQQPLPERLLELVAKLDES